MLTPGGCGMQEDWANLCTLAAGSVSTPPDRSPSGAGADGFAAGRRNRAEPPHASGRRRQPEARRETEGKRARVSTAFAKSSRRGMGETWWTERHSIRTARPRSSLNRPGFCGDSAAWISRGGDGVAPSIVEEAVDPPELVPLRGVARAAREDGPRLR